MSQMALNGSSTIKTVTLTAFLYREDDMYVAKCPQTDTVSQGLTIEEVLANLKEATELYLTDEPELVEEIGSISSPIITSFEVDIA